MHVDVFNLARTVGRNQSVARSAARASVKPDFVAGANGRPLRDELKARGDHWRRQQATTPLPAAPQTDSARRTSKICWQDLLLFVAVGACVLSAAGVIPKALSLAFVAFLFACALALTGVMLFWLLCPMSFTDLLAGLRFRAAAASEPHGPSPEAELSATQRKF